MLRLAYGNPLRQVEGLPGSIRVCPGRRCSFQMTARYNAAATFGVATVLKMAIGPIHIVIDSTCPKVPETGNWHLE